MDIPQKYSGYTHIALEVSSIKATLNHLANLDLSLSGGPMEHPTGTSLFIRDPDLNVIEFIEPRHNSN